MFTVHTCLYIDCLSTDLLWPGSQASPVFFFFGFCLSFLWFVFSTMGRGRRAAFVLSTECEPRTRKGEAKGMRLNHSLPLAARLCPWLYPFITHQFIQATYSMQSMASQIPISCPPDTMDVLRVFPIVIIHTLIYMYQSQHIPPLPSMALSESPSPLHSGFICEWWWSQRNAALTILTLPAPYASSNALRTISTPLKVDSRQYRCLRL